MVRGIFQWILILLCYKVLILQTLVHMLQVNNPDNPIEVNGAVYVLQVKHLFKRLQYWGPYPEII